MPKSAFTDAYARMIDTLVETREAAGLTQAELGRRIGKPQPWVSKYERGVRRIDVIEFYAISRALRADPSALFTAIVRDLPNKVDIS